MGASKPPFVRIWFCFRPTGRLFVLIGVIGMSGSTLALPQQVPGAQPGPTQEQGAPAGDLSRLRAAAGQMPTDYIARSRYAMALDRAGQYDEALREFKAAVRLAPESPVVYHNLGVHYLNLRQPALADEAFCRELEVAPGDGGAHYYRGVALQSQRRNAAAAAQFEEAIGLSPNLPDSYLSLAIVRTKELPESKIQQLLDRYIHLTGKPALAHYVMSGAYRTWHKYPEAIRYAEMSVQEEGSNYAYVHNLGQLYSYARHWDDADRTLNASLRLTPKPALPLTELGVNAEKAGRFAPAIEYFHQALAADPTNGLLHQFLYRNYQRQGDAAAAQREERAFRLWQRASTVNR